MKLIAIYSVWDSEEHLEGSIKQIRPYVDHVIAYVQTLSNHNEIYAGGLNECNRLKELGLIDTVQLFDPQLGLTVLKTETHKRQLGINYARFNGYTHFIHLDCDEYYKPLEFKAAKEYIEENNINASVVKIKTYWKNPEWVFDSFDSYYVPFICKVNPETKCGNFKEFLFYCDPTRKINTENAELFNEELVYLHHYSWIRNSIERKIRNSTARANIFNSTALRDYAKSNLGDFVEYYGKRLILAENIFSIRLSERGECENVRNKKA